MSASRLAVLASVICLCTACAEPPTTTSVRGSSEGPTMPDAQVIYGVLEESSDDPSGIVLRQDDRMIRLSFDHAAGLADLVGQHVILSGSFMSDGTFRVTGVRRASNEPAFARR